MSEKLVIREGQVLDDDASVFERNDAPAGREIGCSDPHVRIGETLDIFQPSVFR